MSIAVIFGGTRANGNTETLTNQAIQGLVTEKIYLKDFTILPIEDHRHSEEGFHDLGDDYNSIIKRVLEHDILIIATPVYWYSMSGTMKNFVDRWSQTLRDPNFPDFRKKLSGKKAFVIAVGGDQPYLKALPLIQQFQYIFQFFGTSFEGYIIGEASKPGDILQDKVAFSAAAILQNKLRLMK